MISKTFNSTIKVSILKYWNLNALSNYKSKVYSYSEIAYLIKKNHCIFEKTGIKKGDKIALIGKNSKSWAITYLSVVTYGAVIVPILPDFNEKDVIHILNHSESKFLYSDDKQFERLDEKEFNFTTTVFSLESGELIYSKSKSNESNIKKAESLFASKFGFKLTQKDFDIDDIPNKTLATIVYTSGTTGFSKGVMLAHNSLISNTVYACENMPLQSEDKILSFMPLAHAYGCSFEFLFPFVLGCHITFLNKTPSPKIMLKAFSEVRPNLILSVPLIIEKIYYKQVRPTISKPTIKKLLKIPLINKIIYKKIRNKLQSAFGGNFIEVVIGGAALNAEVEAFFRKIEFPYTIGYGMTECGPLISYSGWKIHKLNGVGRVVDQLEIRIDSEDQQNIPGEILVRGENVMEGYYKNAEITKETIDKNGWLHTGDIGIIDSEGFIYIKGRIKSMILGPSGQNIYPEEIESKLNNLDYVQESLILHRDGKMIALVYPDREKADKDGKSLNDLDSQMQKNKTILNQKLPSYSVIHKIELYPEEFKKTPTKKIKRFLYNH